MFRPTDPAFAGSVSPYPVSSVESTVARSAEINSARICVTPYCQASPLRLLPADDLDQTFDYLIDLFSRSAAESLPQTFHRERSDLANLYPRPLW
jgi:hypothetical protein